METLASLITSAFVTRLNSLLCDFSIDMLGFILTLM